MRVDRRAAILELLTLQGLVTAGELARHFGVTTRTIYRDIKQLEKAGTPVYMTKGKGGGVRLAQEGQPAKLRRNTGMITVRLYIRPEAAERAMGEFSGWQQQEDGTLLCDCELPATEETLHRLLSYGPGCAVLEPQQLRQKLAARLHGMVEYYI